MEWAAKHRFQRQRSGSQLKEKMKLPSCWVWRYRSLAACWKLVINCLANSETIQRHCGRCSKRKIQFTTHCRNTRCTNTHNVLVCTITRQGSNDLVLHVYLFIFYSSHVYERNLCSRQNKSVSMISSAHEVCYHWNIPDITLYYDILTFWIRTVFLEFDLGEYNVQTLDTFCWNVISRMPKTLAFFYRDPTQAPLEAYTTD